MGSLNETLGDIRERGAAKRPAEVTALMYRATDELRASGIAERVPGPGDPAPLFARPNLSGETIRFSSVLRRRPAVLSFFRGRW